MHFDCKLVQYHKLLFMNLLLYDDTWSKNEATALFSGCQSESESDFLSFSQQSWFHPPQAW